MKKVIISMALGLAMIAASSGTSFAQPPEGKGMGFKKFNQSNQEIMHPGKSPNHTVHPGKGVGLGKKLNLSQDQEAKAKHLREQSRTKIEPIIQEMRTARQKLREMAQNNASKEEIQKQRQKIGELMEKAKAVHQQNLANFEQILNPEQKTQFESLKEERMKKFQERKGQFQERRNNGQGMRGNYFQKHSSQ